MKHLLWVLSFLLLSYSSKSNGYLGGGLSYQSDGNGKVTFVFSFLKDCSYCDSGNCAISKLTLSGKNYLDSFNWKLDSSKRVSRPENCKECDRCTDPNCEFEFGLSLLFYSCKVDISSAMGTGTCQYTASLSTSAISDRITTGPAGFVPFHELHFEACVPSKSPKIRSFGTLIPSGGNVVDRIFKTQKDSSLSFFKSIRNKDGLLVKYSFSYSSNKPISYLGFPKDYPIERFPFGLNLDSANSIIQFRPMKLEHSITRIGNIVSRNGKILSTSYIDYYFGCIKRYDAVNAVFSGVEEDFKEGQTITVCEGDSLNLIVNTSDRDSSDSTIISWDEGIPNASFTIIDSNVKDQSATIKWFAPIGSSGKTYKFVIFGNNNACPLSVTSAIVLNLEVLPKPQTMVKVGLVDSFGTAFFTAKQTGTVPIDQFIWKIDDKIYVHQGANLDSLIHRFKDDSTYLYQLLIVGNNGCVNTTNLDSIRVKSIRYSVDWAKVGLQVYPNPASNYLQIENGTGTSFQLKLFNIKGQMVLQTKVSKGSNRIDLEGQAKGVYTLSAEIEGIPPYTSPLQIE